MSERERKEQAFEAVQYKVNNIKSELIDIMYKLEEAGIIRKADSLSTIIGKLEDWQNTRL